MKRVGVYLRVSSEEQKLDLQRDELMQFVTARGWKVIGTFEEKLTGTNANRPELKKLMAVAQRRELDIVLCWKLDRFFRSLKDLVVTIQLLDEIGVQFVSMRDNLDLTTSQGRLFIHLLGSFSEFEASLIRARCKAGMDAYRRRNGKWGRPKTVDTEAIIRLRDQRLTYRQISKELGVSHGSVHATLNSGSK